MIQRRTKGVLATRPFDAGIAASLIEGLAVADCRAIRIPPAFGLILADALFIEELADWTDTRARGAVIDEAAGFVTHAPAFVVDDKAKVFAARDTNSVVIECVTRRTDALFILIQDQAPTRWTCLDGGAFQRSVALVTGQTDAGHCPDGECIQHRAFGVDSTRVLQCARIDTDTADAGRLGRTVPVSGAANHDLFTGIAAMAFKSRRTVTVDLVILDKTFGRSIARILNGTRILAAFVDAHLVGWAFGVVGTFDGVASDIGIALQTWRTCAGMAMVNAMTLGVAAARQVVLATDGRTLAQSARVGALALVVRRTAHGHALNFRVAVEIGIARADRSMVDHVTEGIEPAGTRVFADGVDAGLLFVTFVISFTAGNDGIKGLAADLVIGDIAIRTPAYHGLDWQRFHHLTRGRMGAWLEDGTGIHALGLQADLADWAVFVLHTVGCGQRDAGAVPVAGVAQNTTASGHMGRNQTLGIRGTRVVADTGIEAIARVAGLSVRTFVIGAATNWRAVDERIALKALEASAVGLVVL